MKKMTILITSIITLIFTFIFAEIFSVYNFGSVSNLLTVLYLISMFSVFEYFIIFIIYIFRKLLNKEKIDFKKIIGLILLFIALLLILLFFVVVDIDYLNWYMYSSPFYINVIIRSVEFLLPSIILIVISVLLIKCKKKNN